MTLIQSNKFETLYTDYLNIEELSNEFETLYTDYLNKKTETQCDCVCSYCYHITTEVKETELELQLLNELLQVPETRENLDAGINKVKPTILVESGTPSAIADFEHNQLDKQYGFNFGCKTQKPRYHCS